MPLVSTDRLSEADLETWRRRHMVDALHSEGAVFRRRARAAVEAIDEFFADSKAGYVSVSWGKDSTVLAHLVHRSYFDPPVVWVKIDPLYNPECETVRDVFLERFDIDYHEIVVPWRDDQIERWAQNTGKWSLGWSPPESAAVPGFEEAADRFGARHVSGVREEESDVRQMRMLKWGIRSPNTCAPIGWWTHRDVFAYLYLFDLPIHPHYAMSLDGALARRRLRVDALGGGKGKDKRRRIEGRYYRDRIRIIRKKARHARALMDEGCEEVNRER